MRVRLTAFRWDTCQKNTLGVGADHEKSTMEDPMGRIEMKRGWGGRFVSVGVEVEGGR